MFHQSIRYFRPSKIVIFGNPTGGRVGRWQTERRPIEAPSNKTVGSSPQEENLSFGDFGQSSPDARGPNIRGNSSFRDTTHVNQAVKRGADPTERLRQAVTVSGDAKVSASPVLFHRNIRTRYDDPIRHSGAITGTPLGRSGGNPAGIQSGLNARKQIATGIGQTVSDTDLHASYPAIDTSMTPSAGVIRVRSFDKIFEHRNSVPTQVSSLSAVDRAPRSSAGVQNTPPSFGRVSKAIGNTSATPGNHFPAVANAPAKLTLYREAAGVPSASGSLDFGEQRQTHLSEGSASADRSTSIVGELWLDTLSLREWLHAYLTGEMRHASQAANRPGAALA